MSRGRIFLSGWLAIEKRMLAGTRQLIFVEMGAFWFSEAYKRADSKCSPGQLPASVGEVAYQQLYRAMTIIKGEPYHHA